MERRKRKQTNGSAYNEDKGDYPLEEGAAHYGKSHNRNYFIVISVINKISH